MQRTADSKITSDTHTISRSMCFLQIYCLYTYASVEFCNLAVMSYDSLNNIYGFISGTLTILVPLIPILFSYAKILRITSDTHTISRSMCFLQIYCLNTYASVEFCNLAVMSYDRYLAICCPLHYKARLTSNKVALFITLIWLYSLIKFLITLSLNLRLTLCGNVIDRLSCHNYYVVKLACTETSLNNIYGFISGTLTILVPLIPILFSYAKILRVCLSSSKETRQKAVRTCSPHIASLINFTFGCCFETLQTALLDQWSNTVVPANTTRNVLHRKGIQVYRKQGGLNNTI
ncbi:unnamed protein product [Gadus morhua 'NCC']